ncbi:HK97 family phage prohead protease [Sporosarcina sp. P21c]|uniref:HK97 family phage prohead protease n=1 Tax=Sporosarcina sp. P21c TaxID=2048255 RepID=UPI000C164374|nr:HK97 family phage prohead protease [Sporosarcina sp. P21c]PIC88423.1 HK97 family phage prohead protease [Sporosarcina sp. P21c]
MANEKLLPEKRGLEQSTIELRESEDGKRTLTGYALKWEMKSHPLGYMGEFREQFQRGAFTETLQKDDQRALWSHDTSKVLGRTGNGTLRLTEDEVGLRFDLDLPNTTLGNDTYETIKRGDVDGVSFGFVARRQEWDETDDDYVIRTITDAALLEISPTAWPAYPDSGVSARGNDPYKQYVNDQEARQKLILETYL